MSHSQPPYGGQGPYGQQPQPGYQPPSPQQPKRKRHIVRNVLLGIVGLVVIIIVATAVSGGGKASPPAASNPGPVVTSAAAASPAAAAPPAKPRVLLRFGGSGIRNSAPFDVGSGALTVHYTFDCSSFGQAGNFQADLVYGNQSSLSGDDQPVANALALSGSTTTTVYPQDPGKDYYLAVNSECSWKVRVSG
jgi:hypothetical protein